ncbi:guanine deaminase [Leekyejoonella antrihumi]|uniref:Guanine deaminase n=1 Tax=Leekyejoonella antrihumi TaxID=1660198 RepID=A0A563E3P3_9MICO|nr:guanine deaminase [Leekyejoonella antrihumi]TWP37137.1 guanine deaminase [Leekyejoonella antrihumi]
MKALFRATVLDTPDDPFHGGALRAESDLGLLVQDGVIVARAAYGTLRAAHPDSRVHDLREGLLLPGLIDTHVHFPQLRVIGALGRPLLDWLRESALPEEARLADTAYAQPLAQEFVQGLLAAGTTTALVFGSHFASAVDAFCAEADRRGLRATTGLVVSDRILRPDLLTTPQRAYDEGKALADRWHGVGRLRYAVTPRFSVSCTDDLLESCAALAKDIDHAMVTSHINESPAEVQQVRELFEGSADYLDTYDRHGLVDRDCVLAHNVHPSDRELDLLATREATISHCPTSNAALGSGMFPMRDHLERGVHVALGSDVGGGTGLSLFKEGLQAYFVQQLLADRGQPLNPAHLLHLATAAGARALDLSDQVGDLSVGKQMDAVWLAPAAGTPLDIGLRHAGDASDALAKVFAMAHSGDVRGVWVGGDQVLETRHLNSRSAE